MSQVENTCVAFWGTLSPLQATPGLSVQQSISPMALRQSGTQESNTISLNVEQLLRPRHREGDEGSLPRGGIATPWSWTPACDVIDSLSGLCRVSRLGCGCSHALSLYVEACSLYYLLYIIYLILIYNCFIARGSQCHRDRNALLSPP